MIPIFCEHPSHSPILSHCRHLCAFCCCLSHCLLDFGRQSAAETDFFTSFHLQAPSIATANGGPLCRATSLCCGGHVGSWSRLVGGLDCDLARGLASSCPFAHCDETGRSPDLVDPSHVDDCETPIDRAFQRLCGRSSDPELNSFALAGVPEANPRSNIRSSQ